MLPMVTCGIDWAQDHHDIAIVDADGRLVAKRRIPESVAGLAELTAMLADAGDDPENAIPVAIETPRGLLVAVLRATGRPIYPINPMSVARYRERTSVSGKKSDHADAVTLANILRTDADQHRQLPADTELAQSITVLARAHQDATWRRTPAGNELRSLLREYFPGFLHAFAERPGGISAPEARAVLAIAPTPAKPTTRSRHTDRRQRIPHEPPLDLLARSEVCGSVLTIPLAGLVPNCARARVSMPFDKSTPYTSVACVSYSIRSARIPVPRPMSATTASDSVVLSRAIISCCTGR
jgi:hypothetical protein